MFIQPSDEKLRRRTYFVNEDSHLGPVDPGWHKIGPHEVLGIWIRTEGLPYNCPGAKLRVRHVDSIVDDGDLHPWSGGSDISQERLEFPDRFQPWNFSVLRQCRLIHQGIYMLTPFESLPRL